MIAKNGRNQRISIGLVWCICGISIGGLVKLAFGTNFSWISASIILLSTIAIVDFRGIVRPDHIPGVVLSIYLYSFYSLALALVKGIPFSGSNVSILYQTVYLLQIILLFALQPDFSHDLFVKTAFWVIGLASVFALVLINIKGFTVGYGILLSGTDETNVVSRATTGFIAFYGVCSSLVFCPKKRVEYVIRVIFIVTSLILLFMSSRRSTLIAVVVVVLLRLRNISMLERINSKRLLRGLAITAMIIAIGVIVIKTNATISDAIVHAWRSLANGFRTYLGIENADRSVAYRWASIESIPYEYFNNSTFIQFVFGRGYNTDWLDIPYLQAFWDLGLVGGIWYFYLQAFTPIKMIMHKPANAGIEFAQYYVVLRIIQNFSNGTPYGTFFPIVLLYVFEMLSKKSDLTTLANQSKGGLR